MGSWDLDTPSRNPTSPNRSDASYADSTTRAGGRRLNLSERVVSGAATHSDLRYVLTDGIDGEALAGREMEHLSLQSKVVARFRAAHDALIGWADGLDAKIVELIRIVDLLRHSCDGLIDN
jgi:hypothetical protein